MLEAVVEADGRVRLDDAEFHREWVSLAALASDYLAYVRLSGKAKASADMAAWECVHDLTTPPAWLGAVDLIDALLAAASTDDDVGMIAAGPLWDLMSEPDEARRFIDAIETRARQDSGWREAVAGVWLDRDADPTVNRRLAVFGAHYPDGGRP